MREKAGEKGIAREAASFGDAQTSPRPPSTNLPTNLTPKFLAEKRSHGPNELAWPLNGSSTKENRFAENGRAAQRRSGQRPEPPRVIVPSHTLPQIQIPALP